MSFRLVRLRRFSQSLSCGSDGSGTRHWQNRQSTELTTAHRPGIKPDWSEARYRARPAMWRSGDWPSGYYDVPGALRTQKLGSQPIARNSQVVSALVLRRIGCDALKGNE